MPGVPRAFPGGAVLRPAETAHLPRRVARPAPRLAMSDWQLRQGEETEATFSRGGAASIGRSSRQNCALAQLPNISQKLAWVRKRRAVSPPPAGEPDSNIRKISESTTSVSPTQPAGARSSCPQRAGMAPVRGLPRDCRSNRPDEGPPSAAAGLRDQYSAANRQNRALVKHSHILSNRPAFTTPEPARTPTELSRNLTIELAQPVSGP